ncbi:MAG: hypothetical protein AABY22_02510 [Nanoarchaeota archaeon]
MKSIILKLSRKNVPKSTGHYFLQCNPEGEPDYLQLVFIAYKGKVTNVEYKSTPVSHLLGGYVKEETILYFADGTQFVLDGRANIVNKNYVVIELYPIWV